MLRKSPKYHEQHAMEVRPGNNMVSKRNHLMYLFSTAIYLYLASFYAQNTFKKLARRNAHKTKYWIWSVVRSSGSPDRRACTPITGKFHKTEISRENIRVNYYLLLKCCRRQCFLLPGVPERQKGKGGGQLFQGALSRLYAQSLPPTLQKYCQTIKHFTEAKVLSTSNKQ